MDRFGFRASGFELPRTGPEGRAGRKSESIVTSSAALHGVFGFIFRHYQAWHENDSIVWRTTLTGTLPLAKKAKEMADSEHLEILRGGVQKWNEWRASSRSANLSAADLRRVTLPGVNLRRVNLSGVNFSGANLQGANLSRANLRRANLAGANLGGANLRGAGLRRANLRRTGLRRADLRGAHLPGVDFHRAILLEANLCGANLNGANLRGANLRRACFYETVLGNISLEKAKSLETCIFLGPCPIDNRTIARSWPLPIEFLQGCGLSDWEIEAAQLFQPDLSSGQVRDTLRKIYDLRAASAVQLYSCFLSYSRHDEDFARLLHDSLQKAGVRCWFAPEQMRAGRKIYDQVDQAIQTHDKLLLVLSDHSMRSDWVETEIYKARLREIAEKRRMLFPIGLVEFDKIKQWECFDAETGRDLAREIRGYFIPDFTNWQDEASFRSQFERLLCDLRPELAPPLPR